MEILHFIKWQWGQIHRDTKQLAAMILFVILCTCSGWYVGFSFIFIVATFGGSAILSLLLLGLYEETSKAWCKYKRIKAEEAERIMSKLRSTSKGFF